jgi:hypothetical protein
VLAWDRILSDRPVLFFILPCWHGIEFSQTLPYYFHPAVLSLGYLLHNCILLLVIPLIRSTLLTLLNMVRRGSYGAAWLSYGAAWLSYGAAWLSHGAAWLSMVRCGSVSSASACCKAGPSSILGLTPQRGSSH